MSVKNKIEKVPNGLQMVNDVIQDQLKQNVIKPIDDLDEFVKNNKSCSFVANMPIFKPNNDTTKCRIVMLSNLKEKFNKNSVSHNEAINRGPQLNRPIETSVILLRFDPNLLIFDLRKAFLQLKLYLVTSICALQPQSVHCNLNLCKSTSIRAKQPQFVHCN